MQAKLGEVTATRNVALGYLRAFVTVLVVLHHAVLPYITSAPTAPRPFTETPFVWGAFPVIDPDRFALFDLLVGYDDIFFMSLLFFLSGLFVPESLARKGAATFLRDRFLRLGLPFLVSAGVLAPLAYYPAFLQAGGGSFARTWLSLGSWPAGPAWFLWVLLVLDVLAAAVAALAPRALEGLARLGGVLERPLVFFLVMIALTAVAYMPLATLVSPDRWISWGPFFVQGSRILHYAVWFFAGAAIGGHGISRGLLASGGRLARRFWAWLLVSLVSYLVEIVVVVVIFQKYAAGETPSTALLTVANAGFVWVCASTCLAFLGVATRFARPLGAMDALSRNAYGMYLFHYALVSWVAFALVSVRFSGAAKGALVFVCAAAGSVAVTALLRRVRPVARVIG